MAPCRFHPQSEAIAYCATCRALLCRRCGQPGKTCSLCQTTSLSAPPSARAAAQEAAKTRCVRHAQALNTKPCHDCGKSYCPACLNWKGVCATCAPSYPAAPSADDAPPRKSRRGRPHADLSYTGGLNRHKGWRRRLTRILLGSLVLGGIGAILSFQYGVFKDFATQAVASRAKLQGLPAAGGGRNADLTSMMQRLESGTVTEADVAATERLMARIQDGEAVDTGQRDALAKLSRLAPPHASAAASDPQAQKLWAMLSDWSNDAVDAPETRPAAEAVRPKARNSKPLPWKVSLLSPSPGARVKGLITVSAQIEGQGALERVEFLVNGEWQGLSNRPPFTFDWETTSVRNGVQTLEIVAYEPSGAKHASRRVRVTVAN
jgi:hypothetical protein